MSENDDSHCGGTTKVAVASSRKGTPEQESLQASSENRHRGYGGDMLRQTVPSTSSGNGKGPITDGGQPCMTDSDNEEVEHRRSSSSCRRVSDSNHVAISWLHYLLPDKRDSSVTERLRHAKTFELLPAGTDKFRNSFLPYCLQHYD